MHRDDLITLGASGAVSAGVLALLWRWDVIRPGSFPADRQRDVTDLPTPIWFVCAILVELALIEGSILAPRILAPALDPADPLKNNALLSLVAYTIAATIGLLMLWFIARHTNKDAGLRIRAEDFGRGVVAMVLLAPMCIFAAVTASGIAEFVNEKAPDPVQHETLKLILDNRTSCWAWILAGCAAVGAPIVEELIFRAFLQSCLLRTLGRTWPAIIGTSAIFTAMHFLGGSGMTLPAAPPLFVLSVGMGLAYERTRGIATSMTMHMLFNAGNIALGMLISQQGSR